MTVSQYLLAILWVKKITKENGKVAPLSTQSKRPVSIPTRKITWIIAIILLFAIAGGYTYYVKVFAALSTSNTSQTQTATVRGGDLVLSASGSGTLVAQSDASFGFDTSGVVTAVHVKVGDQVEAGQVLAELDSTLAQMKYDEAQQALRELYSPTSIAAIEQKIATAQDSEAAAKDWLAYLISPEVVEAEDNLAIAQKDLADVQAAAKASPSDAANQAVKQKEQVVAYLNDKLTQAWTYYRDIYAVQKFGEYDTVGKGRNRKQVLVTTTDPVTGQEVPVIQSSVAELATARNNIAQAQETISEGQAYLDILNSGFIPDDAVGAKITTLYQARLAVEKAKTALDETRLIAPIGGNVTSLKVNVGEQPGTAPVITISQLSQPYTLDAYIDAADWSMARVGNKVNVAFNLLPEKTFTGRVTLVYPELTESFESSLVHLVVQLDSSISQNLPAGTGATVEILGGAAKGVLIVPIAALHKGQDGKSYVTVLQNGQKVEREVEIGLKNATFAEVKAGLEARETVVTK